MSVRQHSYILTIKINLIKFATAFPYKYMANSVAKAFVEGFICQYESIVTDCRTEKQNIQRML